MLPEQFNEMFRAALAEEIVDVTSPIPEGKYLVSIENAEAKEQRNNPNNGYIQLTLRIIEGNYADRMIWDNLNIIRDGTSENDELTRKISVARLQSVVNATRKTVYEGPGDLIDGICIAHILCRGKGGNTAQNSVKAYYHRDSVMPRNLN